MARHSAHSSANTETASAQADINGLALPTSSATPLYHRLTQALIHQIVSQRWPAGSELPSEIELCEHFAVSRAPCGAPLRISRAIGLLERKQGRGTFVADSSVEGSVLASMRSIDRERSRTMSGHGHQCELRPPLADLRASWAAKGEPSDESATRAIHARRADHAGRKSSSRLTDTGAGETRSLQDASLCAAGVAYGLYFLRAEDAIEPVLADVTVAPHLGVKWCARVSHRTPELRTRRPRS